MIENSDSEHEEEDREEMVPIRMNKNKGARDLGRSRSPAAAEVRTRASKFGRRRSRPIGRKVEWIDPEKEGKTSEGSNTSKSIVFKSFEEMVDYVEGLEKTGAPPGLDTQTYKLEIRKAVKEGRISKQQAKRLRAIIGKLQEEMLGAWAAGQDLEVWLSNIQADGDAGYVQGMNEISVLGDHGGKEPCLVGNGRWLRIKNGVTMDSGSSVFVIPSDWLKMFPMRESEGSRRKQEYTAAAKDSKTIVNEGEKTIEFVTNEGKKKKMVCQVANVNKILASIAGICDKGNHVLFRADGGDIINLKSRKKTPFRRLGNIYVLDAWVENPNWKSGKAGGESSELLSFTRPGRQS